MRITLALIALAHLAQAALSQDGPRRGVVRVAAELRSGPSDTGFPVTNRVPRGTTLEVVGDAAGGWLKVKPPAGSYSWIATRFLKGTKAGTYTPVVMTEGDTVPSYPGSEVDFRKPEVIGARLKSGTLVRPIGEAVAGVDGTMIRIEPPPGEVRYVKATMLEGAATGTFTPATPVTAASPARPASGALPIASTPSANSAQTADELWRQAHSAHVGRRYDEAARLYEETAAAAKANPQLAAAASLQSRAIRAWLASTAGSSFAPARASAVVEMHGRRAEAIAPTGSYRGHLRQAGWSIDGQRAYYLDVQTRGGLRQPAGFYVTGAPGVNVAGFVGREVELAGTPAYRGELKSYHLVATRVQLVP